MKKKIRISPGEIFNKKAIDTFVDKIKENEKEKLIEIIDKREKKDYGGLPSNILVKNNINYMVTRNINTIDGLVNGACGNLMQITFDKNKPSIIWLNFHNKIIGSSKM